MLRNVLSLLCMTGTSVLVCVPYWTYMCYEHRIAMRRMRRFLTNIISHIYVLHIKFYQDLVLEGRTARWSIYIIHFNIVFSTFEALSFYFKFATIYKRYLNSDHSFHLSVSIEFVCLTIIMRACIFILIFTYITVNLTFSSNDFTAKKKVSGICVYYFQFNFLDNYNF